MVTAASLLTQAADLVSGDRDRQHGTKADNFDNIARLWTEYLSSRGLKIKISPADVGLMMGLLKIARTKSGSINIDDYLDACGYIAIAGELSCTPSSDSSETVPDPSDFSSRTSQAEPASTTTPSGHGSLEPGSHRS